MARIARKSSKQTPLQQYGPYAIVALSTAGLGTAIGCLFKENGLVASSLYTTAFGIPLPLLGAIAYGVMLGLALIPLVRRAPASRDLQALRHRLGQVQLMLALVMTVFSGYLVYVMATQLQSLCVPCLISGVLSLTILGLTSVSYAWREPGSLIFWGVIVGFIALISTTGFYAYASNPGQFEASRGQAPPAIETTSGPAEMALAAHLAETGAIKYGAWWCPHCHAQQTLFGQEAFTAIDYVECDPGGVDPQPGLCRAKGVASYPTWEINGQTHSGVQPLERLAQLSNYQGPQNFQNQASP
ncbi:MAG: vitamin K epoxide reductase family protein [Cyanobacteria bacterium P01_A01_bin.135]